MRLLGLFGRGLIVGAMASWGCSSDDGAGSTPATDTGTSADTITATDTNMATDSVATDSVATDSVAIDSGASTDGATGCSPTAVIRLLAKSWPTGTLPTTTAVTPSICATGPVVVGTTRTDFNVPVGAAVYFTASAGTAFYPSASVEWNRPAGSSGDEALDVAEKANLAAVLPAYDATKAHVVVQLVGPATATGTCPDTADFVISVPGHPEATVAYANGGALAIDATLTKTKGAKAAFAFIQNITPGDPVTIGAVRTGCALDFKLTGVYTGRIPLVAGHVVHAVANVVVKP